MLEKSNRAGESENMSFVKIIEKDLTINAIRWFDKKNGNSYHSVALYKENKFIGKENFKYGYDRAYEQTAFDIAIKNKLFNGTRRENGTYTEYPEFLRRSLSFVADVSTQKELKNF
jgi:hypothetical protein